MLSKWLKKVLQYFWDRLDYIKKAEKQLKDENLYKNVNFKDHNLSKPFDESNHFFKELKTKGSITDKNFKCFTYHYMNACNLGIFYLLSKSYKPVSEVAWGPVMSNCGAPTENVPKLLDFQL